MSLQIESPVGKHTHAFATRDLSGWGRYPVLSGRVCRPEQMNKNTGPEGSDAATGFLGLGG